MQFLKCRTDAIKRSRAVFLFYVYYNLFSNILCWFHICGFIPCAHRMRIPGCIPVCVMATKAQAGRGECLQVHTSPMSNRSWPNKQTYVQCIGPNVNGGHVQQ